MNIRNRISFTEEEQAAARASRLAAIQSGAHFRRDYADADHWVKLAKDRGIRLPQWHKAPTPLALRAWSQKAGDVDFEAIFGCSPRRAIELNPKAPLRAFIGWLLEAAKESR